MAKNMVTNALGIGAIALSGSIQFAQRLPFVSTQINGDTLLTRQPPQPVDIM
jgi:hypothetical protein